jgi:hypothetical protein
LYRLQRTRGDDGNLAAGAGALPPPPLAGTAGKSFAIILAISGIPAVSVFPQRADRLADGTASRRDTVDAGVQERRLGPRRGMIDTAESAAARPDQISCATRGDEVINCQIFHPLSH